MRVRVATFTDVLNLGRGLATKVIDLSQAKHRQAVDWMDWNPETGWLSVWPAQGCGLFDPARGRPLTMMHFRPESVIEEPTEPAPEKPAKKVEKP
jgi:hypothetical protein